jgi:hypothetical protein
MVTYYEALIQCGLRYIEMLNREKSVWMAEDWIDKVIALEHFIEEFLHGCENEMPLNKLNRWLGYIQGTLIALEITTVQAERDWTRPLFRPLDYA